MSQSKCSSPASTANSRSSLTRSQALPSLPACARRCSRHAGPTIRRANGSLGGHKPPQSQRCAWSPRWLCCNSAQYAELHGRLRCPSSARMTRHQLHNLLRQRVQRPGQRRRTLVHQTSLRRVSRPAAWPAQTDWLLAPLRNDRRTKRFRQKSWSRQTSAML